MKNLAGISWNGKFSAGAAWERAFVQNLVKPLMRPISGQGDDSMAKINSEFVSKSYS
jgi:hypothetical protein